MKHLCVDANCNMLNSILQPLNEDIALRGGSPNIQMKIAIAVEEIFVNIAHYAYEENGTAEIFWEIDSSGKLEITMEDYGVPFNPLEKKDPDITSLPSKRTPGGMGIYMTKKWMDGISYEYRDGKNRLTMWKNIY